MGRRSSSSAPTGSVLARCHAQSTSVADAFKLVTFQAQVHFLNHQAAHYHENKVIAKPLLINCKKKKKISLTVTGRIMRFFAWIYTLWCCRLCDCVEYYAANMSMLTTLTVQLQHFNHRMNLTNNTSTNSDGVLLNLDVYEQTHTCAN